MQRAILTAAAQVGGGEAWLGPLAALCSALTWAYGSAIYAREARRVSATEVNLTRALFVLPLFVLATLVTVGPQVVLALRWQNLGWLGLSMLCSYGFGDLVYYWAAVRLGTSTALAIASVFPVWSALLGALTLGEHITRGRAVGIALCIAGVVWLVRLQGQGQKETSPTVRTSGRTLFAGVGLAFLSSFLWAGNAYSIRRGTVGLPVFFCNALRYFMAVVLLGATWLVQRRRRPATGEVGEQLLLSRAALRRFGSTVVIEAFFGSSIFVYGLSHSDLSVAAPLSSLAPLFSVPIGLLLGTESLDLRRVGAIGLTVAGVVLLVH